MKIVLVVCVLALVAYLANAPAPSAGAATRDERADPPQVLVVRRQVVVIVVDGPARLDRSPPAGAPRALLPPPEKAL
jgi:hypothetical protein